MAPTVRVSLCKTFVPLFLFAPLHWQLFGIFFFLLYLYITFSLLTLRWCILPRCHSLQGLFPASTKSQIWSTWRLIRRMEVSNSHTHIQIKGEYWTGLYRNTFLLDKSSNPQGNSTGVTYQWTHCLMINMAFFFPSLSLAECQLHNSEWQYHQGPP